MEGTGFWLFQHWFLWKERGCWFDDVYCRLSYVDLPRVPCQGYRGQTPHPCLFLLLINFMYVHIYDFTNLPDDLIVEVD